MRSNQSGINWEVKRGLITPELAERAADQATELRTSQKQAASGSIPSDRPEARDELLVLKLNLDELTPNEADVFSALIEVAETVHQTCEAIVPSAPAAQNACFINYFPPNTSTGEHKDSYAPATVSVGLRGNALAYIMDPIRQEWLAPIGLTATDALCFDNTDPAERPLHRVICDSRLPRIALVNTSR
jgi:hypothetical protein